MAEKASATLPVALQDLADQSPEELLAAFRHYEEQADSQDSIFIKSFWYIKAKQVASKLKQLGVDKSSGEVAAVVAKAEAFPLDTFESCLTDSTRRLSIFSSKDIPPLPLDSTMVSSSLEVNTAPLSELLASVLDHPSLKRTYLDASVYTFATPVVQRLSLACAAQLDLLTLDQFTPLLAPNATASGADTGLLRAFGQYKSGWSYLAFLMSIAALEKTLLNFVLAKHKQQGLDIVVLEPRLRKMKDLLEFPQLLEKHIVVRTFVGTIDSMNIRNLMWHSFLTPGEFHPSYGALALVLALHLQNKLVPEMGDMLPFKLLDFTTFDSTLLIAGPVDPLSTLEADWTEVTALINRTGWIIPGFRELWARLLRLFIEGKYYESLVGLFPLVEGSLRRLFVVTNSVTTARLTAENDTLCLSLDIVLGISLFRELYIIMRQEKRRAALARAKKNSASPKDLEALEAEDAPIDTSAFTQEVLDEEALPADAANLLFHELGPKQTNALFDLMIWGEERFRIRDQLAHGSISPALISARVPQHIFATMLALFVQYDPNNYGPGYVDSLCPTLKQSCQFIENYVPVFHAKAYTVRQFVAVKHKLRELKFSLAQASGVAAKDFVPSPNGPLDPFAQTLLNEALRDMKPAAVEDRKAYLEYMIRNSALQAEFRQNLEAAVTASHNGSKLSVFDTLAQEETPAADPAAFAAEIRRFPMDSPCRTKALDLLTHVRAFLGPLNEFLVAYAEAEKKLREAAVSRKAYKRGRIAFVQILEIAPFVIDSLGLLLACLEEGLFHAGLASTSVTADISKDFPVRLACSLGVAHSAVVSGKYRHLGEILGVTVSPLPECPKDTTPAVVPPNDANKLFCDLDYFLSKVMAIKNPDLAEKIRSADEAYAAKLARKRKNKATHREKARTNGQKNPLKGAGAQSPASSNPSESSETSSPSDIDTALLSPPLTPTPTSPPPTPMSPSLEEPSPPVDAKSE